MIPRIGTVPKEQLAALTPAELEAVTLHELGWGYRTIARHLGVAPTTIRDRIDRAGRKLTAAKEAE